MTQTPWYDFNRIDNFGTIDPAGPYWKPDSNVQLPGDYPVTALLPGVVTSVQNGVSWGQTIVTIKLDDPLNPLATHEFYEHMSSAAVSPGEDVQAGQLVGYNNPAGAVPLGFGFYPGDVYGSGPSWAQDQADLAPGGAGLLNPTAILNAARGGQPITGAGMAYQYASGTDITGTGTAQPEQTFQKVVLILLALAVIIGGVVMIFHQQIANGAKAIGKTAVKAAML